MRQWQRLWHVYEDHGCGEMSMRLLQWKQLWKQTISTWIISRMPAVQCWDCDDKGYVERDCKCWGFHKVVPIQNHHCKHSEITGWQLPSQGCNESFVMTKAMGREIAQQDVRLSWECHDSCEEERQWKLWGFDFKGNGERVCSKVWDCQETAATAATMDTGVVQERQERLCSSISSSTNCNQSKSTEHNRMNPKSSE